MNRLSDATMNGMTKKQLIEYVRMCEHNYDIAEETLKQQAENVKDWKPVKRGKWITTQKTIDDGITTCSYCHREFYIDDLVQVGNSAGFCEFCPACGAKMGGDANADS